MRIDGPAPVNGPTARRRVRSVPWLMIGAVALVAGLLAGVAALIRWWGACLPASIDSAGCALRRSDALGLTGFTVLPIDLRLAAILVATGAIVSAAMWFVPLFVGPAPLWRLFTVTLLALASSAHAFVDMWWYVGGHRLGGSNLDLVSNLSWLVLALMTFTPALQFAAAESLASRRRGGARLALLLIAIMVAGPVGIFADSLRTRRKLTWLFEGVSDRLFGWRSLRLR